MNKHIDAEKLIAEIERLYYNEAEKDESILAADAYKNALDAVEKFIDSLKQEQPEGDFEEEVKSYIKDNFTITDEVAQIPEEDRMYSMRQDDMMTFAKHFYELGQLVMKHSITNRAKVALAKCHTFPDITYFAIGEMLSYILDRTDKEE